MWPSSYAFVMGISTSNASLSGGRKEIWGKPRARARSWGTMCWALRKSCPSGEKPLCFKNIVKTFKYLKKAVALYIHYISMLKIKIRKL